MCNRDAPAQPIASGLSEKAPVHPPPWNLPHEHFSTTLLSHIPPPGGNLPIVLAPRGCPQDPPFLQGPSSCVLRHRTLPSALYTSATRSHLCPIPQAHCHRMLHLYAGAHTACDVFSSAMLSSQAPSRPSITVCPPKALPWL